MLHRQTNLPRGTLANLEAEELIEVNEMEGRVPESLAGQTAIIQLATGQRIDVVFNHDVRLEWASGDILGSKVKPELRPEIKGTIKGQEDLSYIKEAELILKDDRVFKITFHTAQYFTAHESINSRNRVYPEDK